MKPTCDWNAVAPGHEGVAIFMQQHTAKKAEEEDHAVGCRRQAATGQRLRKANEPQQQQEGEVNVNVDPEDATQFEGPFHS